MEVGFSGRLPYTKHHTRRAIPYSNRYTSAWRRDVHAMASARTSRSPAVTRRRVVKGDPAGECRRKIVMDESVARPKKLARNFAAAPIPVALRSGFLTIANRDILKHLAFDRTRPPDDCGDACAGSTCVAATSAISAELCLKGGWPGTDAATPKYFRTSRCWE